MDRLLHGTQIECTVTPGDVTGGRRSAATKAVIFYGPSITACEVGQLITATHAPPIKRGDLEATGGCAVIVILDGEFGQNLVCLTQGDIERD